MPNLHKNLLSVQKLALDNNVFIEFHPHFFLIKDQATRKTLLRGRSHNGLYPVPISSSPPDHAALSSVTARAASVHLWHYRLGIRPLVLFSLSLAQINWLPRLVHCH